MRMNGKISLVMANHLWSIGPLGAHHLAIVAAQDLAAQVGALATIPRTVLPVIALALHTQVDPHTCRVVLAGAANSDCLPFKKIPALLMQRWTGGSML